MSHPSSYSLSKQSFVRGAIVALMIAAPSLARADLPRPEGWKPTCTSEIEQDKGGGPCEQCNGWKDPDPCQKALEDKGYSKRCTEGGAGSYVAVWCKSAAGSTNAVTPPPTPSSTATNTSTTPPQVAPAADNRRGGGLCSVVEVGRDKQNAASWSLVMVALGLISWRRRAAIRHVGPTNQRV